MLHHDLYEGANKAEHHGVPHPWDAKDAHKRGGQS
jgi:hypothetical protein